MKSLLTAGEWVCGILVDLLTIPMLFLGLFIGVRGSVRYLKMKFM
jgi:hypothetical protein